MSAKPRLVTLAMVLCVVLAERAQAQCLLDRLFNRETTYTTQYGGYSIGYAYLPVVTAPTAMPVVPRASYRVTYLPVTPGATTVYRPAPVIYEAPVVRTSYLPVATPYAVPPAVSTTTVPMVAYRPVEVVYEPRRLFNWRPFANLRARRAGYWPGVTAPTWSTAYLVTCPSVPGVSDCTVCGTPPISGSYASSYTVSGGTVGCPSCAPAPSSSWQPSVDTSIPTLPSASPSDQPPATFKQESSTTTGSFFRSADSTSGGTNATGTSVPVSEAKPLVRQALYEKPIPLVEEVSDPPMVDVTGWRRSP